MNRYGLHSVTGYPEKAGGAAREVRTIWYVHDKTNCYHLVASFNYRHTDPEGRARRLCRLLNADERAWERAGRENGA